MYFPVQTYPLLFLHSLEDGMIEKDKNNENMIETNIKEYEKEQENEDEKLNNFDHGNKKEDFVFP